MDGEYKGKENFFFVLCVSFVVLSKHRAGTYRPAW